MVLRAVREEDMSAHEAADEKYRLDDEAVDTLTERDETALPAGLVALVTEARTLFTRICRLDREIFQDTSDEETQPGSIRGQLDALQSAAASGVFDPLSVWRRG